MLTDVLRRSLYTEWSTAWLRQHLAQRPSGVRVDDLGRLVLEMDQGSTEVVWSPGELVSKLQQSEPNANTVQCCWRLCRHYDDWQETAAAVTISVQKQLDTAVQHAAWYWDDQHGVLLATASIAQKPADVQNIKIRKIVPASTETGAPEAPYHSVALLPSAWLHACLLEHLKTRAVIQIEGQKDE